MLVLQFQLSGPNGLPPTSTRSSPTASATVSIPNSALRCSADNPSGWALEYRSGRSSSYWKHTTRHPRTWTPNGKMQSKGTVLRQPRRRRRLAFPLGRLRPSHPRNSLRNPHSPRQKPVPRWDLGPRPRYRIRRPTRRRPRRGLLIQMWPATGPEPAREIKNLSGR